MDDRSKGGKNREKICTAELLKALKDENPRIRLEAIFKLRGYKSIALPINALLSEDDPDVLKHIIKEFGCRGDCRAAKTLIKMLQHSDQNVRIEAIIALDKMRHTSTVDDLTQLSDNNKAIIEAVVDVLGNLKNNKSGEIFLQRKIINALGKIPKPYVLKELIHLLHKGNEKQKIAAVHVSRILEEDDTLKYLVEVINDRSSNVRTVAVKVLKEIPDDCIFELLVKSLQDDDESVREEAILGMIKIDRKQAITILNKFLAEQNSHVRKTTIKIFGNIGGKDLLEIIIKYLNDENTDVQKTAIKALLENKNKMVAEALIHCLYNHHPLKKDIELALKDIGRPAIQILYEDISDVITFKSLNIKDYSDYPNKRIAVETLININYFAIRRLHKIIRESSSYMTRKDIAEGLGNSGNPLVTNLLITLLGDEDSEVREAAAEALTQPEFLRSSAIFFDEWKKILKQIKEGNSQALECACVLLKSGDIDGKFKSFLIRWMRQNNVPRT